MNILNKLAIRQSLKSSPMMNMSLRMFSVEPQHHHYSHLNVIVEKREGGVGLVQLNRPKALNALCDALFKELNEALHTLDADPEIGCIVLTGNEKAFAAGADVKEMKDKEYPDTFMTNMLSQW